jgi:hypothetical protein
VIEVVFDNYMPFVLQGNRRIGPHRTPGRDVALRSENDSRLKIWRRMYHPRTPRSAANVSFHAAYICRGADANGGDCEK